MRRRVLRSRGRAIVRALVDDGRRREVLARVARALQSRAVDRAVVPAARRDERPAVIAPPEPPPEPLLPNMSAAPGPGPDVCPVLAHDAAPATPAASPRIASVRQPMECTTNGLVAPPEGSRLTNRPRKREPRSGPNRDYSARMRPRSPYPFAGVAALLATAAGCSAPGHAVPAGIGDASAGEAAPIEAGGAVQTPGHRRERCAPRCRWAPMRLRRRAAPRRRRRPPGFHFPRTGRAAAARTPPATTTRTPPRRTSNGGPTP